MLDPEFRLAPGTNNWMQDFAWDPLKDEIFMGHRIRAAIHFDDLQSAHSYDRTAAYGQSKLANLLFTYELQRRLAAADATTIAVAAHPGIAATELGRNAQLPVRMGMRLLTPFMILSGTAIRGR